MFFVVAMVLFAIGNVDAQIASSQPCPLQAFRDSDGDRYADQTETICLRIQGATEGVVLAVDGYLLDDDGANNDCDDTNAAIHPGAIESANSIDDNCDGLVDEGIQATKIPPKVSSSPTKKKLAETTAARCTDGIDNDADGKRDRKDPDCYRSVIRDVGSLWGKRTFSGNRMTKPLECRYYLFEYDVCACEIQAGYEFPDTRCEILKRYKSDD